MLGYHDAAKYKLRYRDEAKYKLGYHDEARYKGHSVLKYLYDRSIEGPWKVY